MPLLFSIVVFTLVVLTASAEEPRPQAPSTGWFFSAGTSIRTIHAGIQFRRHSPLLDWTNFFDARTAVGDSGLYQGGTTPVTYLDGIVGPQNPDFPDGVALGRVDTASQVLPHPLGSGNGGFANAIVAFHSQAYRRRAEALHALDEDGTGAGPSLQWGYRIADNINLVSGWTLVSANQDTGARPVIEVFEDQLNFTYLYDYLADGQTGLLIPGTVDGLEHGIIYDAEAITPIYGPGYQSPRQSVAVIEGRKPLFYAVARTALDVTLQEIPFGIEAGRRIGPFECHLTGGATLNLIDFDLSSRLDWYKAGSPSPSFSGRWHDAGSPVKAGLFGGVTAKLFLDDSRRLYVESSTSYRWVDPVHASAGPVTVEIDVSSWEGRFALGVLFD